MRSLLLSLALLASALPVVGQVQLTFGSVLTVNTSAAPDSAYLGAPDSSTASGSGAGTAWGGLGNGQLVFDFGKGGIADVPGVGGEVWVFEVQWGSEESNSVAVKVSADGVNYVDLSATRATTATPAGAAAAGFSTAFTRLYSLPETLETYRYLMLQGLAGSAPGQSSGGGSGFDPDAVGVVIPEPSAFLFVAGGALAIWASRRKLVRR